MGTHGQGRQWQSPVSAVFETADLSSRRKHNLAATASAVSSSHHHQREAGTGTETTISIRGGSTASVQRQPSGKDNVVVGASTQMLKY